MRSLSRLDPRCAPAHLRRRGGLRVLGAIGLTLLFAAQHAPAARAEQRWLLQGLVDTEYWNTDGGSTLLERNGGRGAGAGQLRVWAAWEPFQGAQLFTRAAIEGGKGSEDGEREERFELAFARYAWGSRTRMMVQAGRIGMTFGSASRRYLSSANPLVGEPGGYGVSYPNGAALSCWSGPVEMSVAVVDRPVQSSDDLPKPGFALRPALSVAWKPVIGLRVGAYGTTGPYLSHDVNPILPAGRDWKDFKERVWGFETQFSRGYFEINADFTFTSYDVPTFGVPTRGRAFYIEPKYTWTPRFFTALRLESVREPYIEIEDGDEWKNETVRFRDLELGAGYRLAPGFLVKAAYRIDRWRVDDDLRAEYPDGRAFAVQLSYGFDLQSLFYRPR